MHTCPLCHYEADSAADLLRHMSSTPYPMPEGHTYRAPENFLKSVSDESYKGGFPHTSGTFDVGGLQVEIKPVKRGELRQSGRRVKGAAHRIYVKCPTCHKSIPAGRIHQHVVVHGKRDMVCEICGKGYGTGNHLRAHIRNVHGAQSPRRPGW